MTTPQAKQILLAYRPWTNDALDAEIAEALAMCREDAELAKWFELHCALQNAIHARLKAMAVPEGLRQQIIAEFKPLGLAVWWRRPEALATAAVMMLLIAVGLIWLNLSGRSEQDVSFAAYRNRMVRTAVRAYGMDLETNDAGRIRAYLAGHQAHSDYVLPKRLEQLPAVGCGALSWQGKPVAMVCFRTGKPLAPGMKSDLFLFVIDQKDLAYRPATSMTEFAAVSNLATASWTAGGKVYLLAAFDESELKRQL